MQPNPNNSTTNALFKIAQKELGQFFRAPIAWLFLVAFLMISLFVFFWVEAFFARNIADVRPLFEWMPLLLIFLSSALTMKMWSEERRSGTLEHVLTQPVPLWQFVLGKFLACWALLGLALLLTLPLPITVAFLGDLDWGPVFSGYLAALLLGAAYLSMGLFISARCDNQIVSLILTAALAGVFYLIGAGVLTGLVGNQSAELLRDIGTGSRFESITRGVVDFRDLYYYLSLTGVFLTLNVFSLERGRWAKEGDRHHHGFWRWSMSLVLANVILANFWLGQIPTLRWDTTKGDIYSISSATTGYLEQLQEPILIRGYFSQKTHPLLAPLVPQIQDLLREYEVVGKGRVNVEIIDPTANPEAEDEANNRYNIKPTPFRVNDRHQTAVVNSYFDILVQYGDESQVLSFNDLIEVKFNGESDVDVQLRNPEYDITRMIKKALYAYQSGGNVFANIQQPITLTAYISDDAKLPKELVELRQAIATESQAIKDKGGEKFKVAFVDPDADGGAEGQRITEQYGFAPMAAGLLDATRFYFYVTLGRDGQLMQIPLGDFTAASFKTSLDAGIKRFAHGFTRTVALVLPKSDNMDPRMAHQVGQPAAAPQFNGLRQMLGEDMNVVEEDLSDGRVDPGADILILAAPKLEDDKQRFAVDQFLMRGGTVVVATSPFSADIKRDSLSLERYSSGLTSWLQNIGISMDDKVVMDRQNSAYPVPTVRQVGGMRFQEMRMVDYPYFIDVRGRGLNSDSLITADLPQVTVPWASAIKLDNEKLSQLSVTPLLYSSDESWLETGGQITPTAEQLQYGYRIGDQPEKKLLGVVMAGQFKSFFAGKDSPLVDQAPAAETEESDSALQPINAVLNHSAESAKLILFSSNDLFSDQVSGMLGSMSGGAYLNSLQLAVNAVDWALEDQGLLTIRSRGHFNRTLMPMAVEEQEFWEYLNYGLALVGLLLMWFVAQYLKRMRNIRYQQWLAA